MAAQQFLQVRPGGIGPLRYDAVPVVQQFVEDLKTQVGHPHFVCIREGQGDTEPAGAMILADGVYFAAEITTRLEDKMKEVVPGYSIVHYH